MAKAQFLADLRVGDYVDTVVVVKSKRRIPYRNRPGYYLALILKDRSGAVEGRVWEEAETIDREIAERDVVRVRGIVELYQQLPQVRIASIQKAQEDEYDWTDLVPRTEKDVNALWQRVQEAIERVSNPYLQTLLRCFFDDPEFAEAFRNAPASLYLHHSWVGGLIEHVCTVLDLAETLCRHYPELDRDLLITGVLLHDVGKVREYQWQTDIDRTDEGRLLGHLVLGDEMVAEKIKQIPDFPQELAMRVRHMLISHHGTGEWGAPRPPMTLEAAALHFLEFADAQLKRFATVLKERREPESPWTTYERMLGRRLFAGYEMAPVTPTEEKVAEGEEKAETVEVAPVPSLEELPPLPSELELLSEEWERISEELAEIPKLPETPIVAEPSPLLEPEEEEKQKRRRGRRPEAPEEEGRLPL